MSENVVKVTDSSFEQDVLKSEKAVLVDFWAPWCGPCRSIAPVIEEIASEYADNLKVAKLNVDENQLTASRYGVMSIPTLILFKDGKPTERLIGYMPKEEIKRHIDAKI
ncbi:MAG: thioredoxin [Bacillota bacterium]